MIRTAEFAGRRTTDDRGRYRLYGLKPGTYLVIAGGIRENTLPTAYDGNAPTFFPSATRDAATGGRGAER